MLTEPAIDKNLVKSTIEEQYGLTITNMSFVKGGEASWGYKTETEKGERYFFKIHTHLEEYRARFDLTYRLFNGGGLTNITHPIKNKKEELVVSIDKYPAALFNFISGYNAAEKTLNDKQRFAFGELIGKVHNAKKIIGDFSLKEDFVYGNIQRLLETVQKAETFLHDESIFKREAAELLITNKDKILARVESLQKQGNKLRDQHLDFVICHGEPHNWNTMVNEQGEVFLIDWDDCLFAPKEKDLMMIKDDPQKLNGYRHVVGEFDINPDVLRYYHTEWNTSEIDAWSAQILFEVQNDIQNQHYLEEFTKVLEEFNKI